MKKIVFALICSFISFSAFAETNLPAYIYGKAMVGDLEGLKNLIKQGYSLETKDKDGNTAYCLAVFRRNQTAVKTLELAGVNTKPRCIRNVPIVSEKMIYGAAHDKDIKQIMVWQEYGVPVDLVDPATENTALCHAVYEKDCEAIDILLRAGASEYHACMRRVPQKDRQELKCKPVVIDWQRIGLTALGVGLVGGGVAIALSGGGGGGSSCSVGQHWDGKQCVMCPEGSCWDGAGCRGAYKSEYIDPVTNLCMEIAPPPYAKDTYTTESFETDEYNMSRFLSDVHASSAYARGYTGYIIDRIKDNNFGPLTNGQVSVQDESKDITTKRPRVAILSSGTYVGQETSTTYSDKVEIIDGSGQKKSFYVNKDLAFQETKTGEEEETEKTWKGNLMTGDSAAKLIGYNFDFGYDSALNQGDTEESDRETIDYRKEQTGIQKDIFYAIGSIKYFTTQKTSEKDPETGEDIDTTDTSGTRYLVLSGGDCTNAISHSGYCGITGIRELVDVENCTDDLCVSISDDSLLRRFVYDRGTVNPDTKEEPKYYVYASDDPNPHFQITGDSLSRDQGTILAGIIAALKNDIGMHGVAYNTEILPVIADVIRPITFNAIDTILSGATVDILLQDYSITSDSSDSRTIASYAKDEKIADVYGLDATKAYNAVANNKTIFVIGTGNAGNNTLSSGEITLGTIRDATVSAGVPLTRISDTDDSHPAISDYFVSVTAVRSDASAASYGGYVLTSYAQPCGSTAGYCLSAPGGSGISGGDTDLISTVSATNSSGDDAYKTHTVSGTSEAAAVVAGAASILKAAYPHLTAKEVVTLLFRTATPLGACSDGGSDTSDDKCTTGSDIYGDWKYSTLYGWGLVNLEDATKPVGTLWVNDPGSDFVQKYLGSYLIPVTEVSSSVGMSKSLMSILPDSFTAFDSFNRPFAVNTKALFSNHSVRKDFDDDFRAFMHGRDVMKVEANDQFSMSYAPRTSRRYSPMKTGLMEMNVDLGKTNVGFYYTEDMLNSRGNYFERPLNNPFVQIQEAYGAEARYNLTSNLSVGMTYATGKNGFLGDGDKHFDAPDNRISMISSEAKYQLVKSLMFKASYGVMREQDSVLGMVGTGAFKLNGATTHFASAGVEVKPTDNFKLDLIYTYGWTKPEMQTGLMSLSRLTADGFAAVAQYDLNSDNMLGVSVSSPLRIRSGKVAFNLPVGRSETDDVIYRETFTGSMKPTARELDFALFYKDALTKSVSIQTELGMRLNPDHQREASPDYRAMFGLKWNY